MTISEGDVLPGATLLTVGAEGPTTVSLGDKMKGRKVVIFGLPGAFTGTCTTAHVPSFMRTRDAFAEKGVDEVICITVNDPFVVDAWSKATGAGEAGLTMLADAESAFTSAIGMNFSAPAIGFKDRSARYAMYVEDGVVKVLHKEENAGTCEISGGEALLAAI
ncbi:peroxiredoxin [Thioclava sp. GXIMD2076]|uniref:Glutathione-dependent peroxiredoxin n=1 Tax=Thioclava kandeliae TaxID=3070818 RepID=A0ABV1SEN3_9RHOB